LIGYNKIQILAQNFLIGYRKIQVLEISRSKHQWMIKINFNATNTYKYYKMQSPQQSTPDETMQKIPITKQ